LIGFFVDSGTVQRSKERENNFYDLKDAVIGKLIKLKWAKIIGYHIQKIDEDKVYLQLIQLNNFKYHRPIYLEDISSLEYLGDIGIISAEKTIKTSVNFSQAIEILKSLKNFQSNLQFIYRSLVEWHLILNIQVGKNRYGIIHQQTIYILRPCLH